jgi:hypothetical protein
MFRHKGDVLSLNNFVDRIYPIEPEIKDIIHILTYTSKSTERGGYERHFTTKEMISIFPLWSFHLYVATFQQDWHMEYISVRWYDIPDLVAPIRMSLIEDSANKEATETRVPFGKVEVITSKMLRLPPWRGWALWNICVTMTTDMFHLSESLPGSFRIQ